MQYKYLYEDLITPIKGNDCIVTSLKQLSDKSGLSVTQLSRSFKQSNVYYDRHGAFRVKRIKYEKDESKKRN